MTYVEKELQLLGFKTISKEGNIFKKRIVLSISHLKLQFDCNCPAYPSIRSLGCPLHHKGPGGSMPVEEAKKIPAIIDIMNL